MLKHSLSTRPVKPGPSARALYLGSREHKRVSCTTEALVITNARAQVMRYPVARVARVVCNADSVDWSGPALALCMRAGITITWLDVAGRAMGTIYPQQRIHPAFATLIELWVESTATGMASYQNWLRSRRMDVLIRWGKACANVITPQRWESTKREWVYARQYTVHLPEGLRGLCLAYIAAQLSSHGLTPELRGSRLQGINLDEDLCELLWAEMNLGSGALADKAEADAELTALFERWSNHNASAITLHLASLHRTALKALHS